MTSIFFSFVAFMTTTTILLFVGWYIIEIRRSPKCSCWTENNPVKLIFPEYCSQTKGAELGVHIMEVSVSVEIYEFYFLWD